MQNPTTPFPLYRSVGQVLILSPVKDEHRRKAFHKALDKANAKYPKALKKLAE